MNYLAHAYLSFKEPEILVGNMISDFIKGKRKFEFPMAVQKGISLHRAIDQFTDDHPKVKEAKEFFRPAYRLYSGAFIDVVFDHFVANDKELFGEQSSLLDFTAEVYAQLKNHYNILPERFQHMLPYMEKHNWLYNYQFESGLQSSLEGLKRRAVYIRESATAFEVFKTNYSVLLSCYKNFFPELKNFSKLFLSNLLDS